MKSKFFVFLNEILNLCIFDVFLTVLIVMAKKPLDNLSKRLR